MQQSLLSPTTSPSVLLHGGRPATTSLEVAKFFGKRHDHVLRDIDNLLSQLPEKSLQPNFGETFQEQETPFGVKQIRLFILYRDGFMLLVMGYTGKKALQIKLAYIEAFNRMEAQLAARDRKSPLSITQQTYTLPSEDYEKATAQQRRPIDQVRKAWVAAVFANGRMLKRADSWKIIKAHFGNIDRLDKLPVMWIEDVVQFCQEMLERELENKPEEAKALPEVATMPIKASRVDKAPILKFIQEIEATQDEMKRILSFLDGEIEYLGLYINPDIRSLISLNSSRK